MAEPSPTGDPTNPSPPPTESTELVASVSNLLGSKPQAVETLFRAFITAVGPGVAGRRLFSVDTLRLVVAYDEKRSDQSHARQMALIAAGLVALVIVCITLLALLYLIRDRVELVRAVLACVGLSVTHGACTAGGYVAGRGQRRRGAR